MKMFSIITVTKDNLSGLKKTAHSVRGQSFQNFEWLIIDGDSNDGTVDYLKTTAAKWVSERDQSHFDAMNKGLDKAQGDFIIFMNAGDQFADHHVLEKLKQIINHNHPDFIYGDALEERRGRSDAVYKYAKSYDKIAHGMITHHQSMIYKATLLQSIRYDLNFTLAADYKLTVQAIQKAQVCFYADFPICLFEAGGISQNHAAQARREEAIIRRDLNLCSPIKGQIIYMRQTMAMLVKSIAPGLYWWLHKKSKASSEQ